MEKREDKSAILSKEINQSLENMMRLIGSKYFCNLAHFIRALNQVFYIKFNVDICLYFCKIKILFCLKEERIFYCKISEANF